MKLGVASLGRIGAMPTLPATGVAAEKKPGDRTALGDADTGPTDTAEEHFDATVPQFSLAGAAAGQAPPRPSAYRTKKPPCRTQL